MKKSNRTWTLFGVAMLLLSAAALVLLKLPPLR
jgi:hypothetical protein